MPDVQTPSDPTPPPAPAADPIASLKKMSTTAGVGSQEYVAISPVAIATVLLGAASAVAILHDVLLVVPAAAVVCFVLAWRQIRDSNGTQSGVGLAGLGLLLAVVIGGGVVVSKFIQRRAQAPEAKAAAAVIEDLGRRVAAGQYDAAYDLFSGQFKARVSPELFRDTWAQVSKTPALGSLRSIEWNGRVVFEEEAGSGTQSVWAGSLVHFENPPDPGDRWQFRMSKTDGRWQIDEIPDIVTFKVQPRGGRRG